MREKTKSSLMQTKQQLKTIDGDSASTTRILEWIGCSWKDKDRSMKSLWQSIAQTNGIFLIRKMPTDPKRIATYLLVFFEFGLDKTRKSMTSWANKYRKTSGWFLICFANFHSQKKNSKEVFCFISDFSKQRCHPHLHINLFLFFDWIAPHSISLFFKGRIWLYGVLN